MSAFFSYQRTSGVTNLLISPFFSCHSFFHSFSFVLISQHPSRARVSIVIITFDTNPNRLHDGEHWFVSCTSAKPICLNGKMCVRRKPRRCVMVFQREKAKSYPGFSRVCQTRKLRSRSRSVHAPFKNIYSVSICILMSTREARQFFGCSAASETFNQGVWITHERRITYVLVRHFCRY